MNDDDFIKDTQKIFQYNPLFSFSSSAELSDHAKKLDIEWRKKQGIFMRRLSKTPFTYHFYSGEYYLYLDGKLQGTFKTFKAMMDFVNE